MYRQLERKIIPAQHFWFFFKKTVQDWAKEGSEEFNGSAVFDLVKVTQPSETVTDYNNNLEAGSNSGILKMYG